MEFEVSKIFIKEKQILIDDMRKGISPLIAAVILIAATMSIAGILSYWASSFVQGRLEESENVTSEEQTQCIGAKFRLYSTGTYTNSTDILRVILENQRSYDLLLRDLYLFYPNDEFRTVDLNDVLLEKNVLKQFNFTVTTGDDFYKGQIRTNCPEVYVEFTNSGGTITQVT